MKFKYKIICIVIIFIYYFYTNSVIAVMFNMITVMNYTTRATISFDCNIVPVYMIFSLHNPERIVIDFFKHYSIRKNVLPMNFNNNNNLIKCVRVSTPVKAHSMRIVLDLTDASTIEVVTQKKMNKNYRLILTLFKKKVSDVSNTHRHKMSSIIYSKTHVVDINGGVNNKIYALKKNITLNSDNKNKNVKKCSIIVIAIDAGHGGQDPGATGYNGMHEKNITINIARKLQRLLNLDPMFNAVMVRDGDYFLSIKERSDIARKKGADVLISIHTDSSLNTNVRGASVWVLSNRRAQSEMIYLLNRSEKHSELLGGLGDILTHYHKDDPYLNHFILDLQFGYSQRVGYDLATHVLCQLKKNISLLHKNLPEHSNFGILRSPDIPSILVETGFISNKTEVRLLSSNKYQEKIAIALYKGLQEYFITLQCKKSLDNDFHNKNMYIIAAS